MIRFEVKVIYFLILRYKNHEAAKDYLGYIKEDA